MLRFISRILTGLLFIFSGLVKAVDPVGGAIKFKDYFDAFGLEFLNGTVLPLAILLSTFEFVIGFHLLVGIRLKQSSVIAYFMILFFTALTLVLAVFNPVSDCGCFGDAIKLDNWSTFFKNLITLPFTWILYRNRNNFKEMLPAWRINSLTLISVVFAAGISVYSYRNLPLLDFRPYKTGANIPDAMKIPEGAPQPEYKTTFILEKDGVRKEFDEKNYPYSDTSWLFIDSKTELIKEGYQPPISDFYITNKQGNDVTKKILTSEAPLFLMIAPDVSGLNAKKISGLAKLSDKCRRKGIDFYCVTSSLYDDIIKFEMKQSPMFNYLFADDVLLQTIIRSNPGLVVLKNGTILAKYSYVNTPSTKITDNTLSYILKEKSEQSEKYTVIILILLLIVITLIFYKKQ